MYRSASSHSFRSKLKTPGHYQQLQKKRERLITRNIRTRQFSSNYKDHSNRETQVSPFRETGTTFQHPRNFSQRVRSSQNFERIAGLAQSKISQMIRYKNQTFYNKFHKKTPLNLLKIKEGRQKSINQQTSLQKNPQQQNFHKKFLRKGTGVNKLIVLNVLKSKYNTSVAEGGFSFINNKINKEIQVSVKKQIPKGLRDSVSAEQMLRMSNIFTGGSLKYIDLHERAKKEVLKYQMKKEGEPIEDETTLKSIKRW